MTSQIEKDLTKNAHERLIKWIDDTIMRFEAMNLKPQSYIACIVTMMGEEMTKALVHLGMDREDFHIIMDTMYQCEVRKSRAEGKEKP